LHFSKSYKLAFLYFFWRFSVMGWINRVIPLFIISGVFGNLASAQGHDRLRDTVKVGRGTTAAKTLEFDQGLGASNAKMQANASGKLEFTEVAELPMVGPLELTDLQEVRFFEDLANGTNYVGFKAPADLAANKIWTLPSIDGSANQVLATDGSGTLQWASPLSNAMDETGDILYSSDESGTPARLDFGAANTVLKTAAGTVPSWGKITNDEVDAAAGIAGTKISPTFTSNVAVNKAAATISLTDSSSGTRTLVLGSDTNDPYVGSSTAHSLRFITGNNGAGNINSTGQWTIGDTTGANTHVFTSGDATTLNITAAGTNKDSVINIIPSGTGAASIEVGSASRPGAGNSFIDFNTTAGIDYSARFLRENSLGGKMIVDNTTSAGNNGGDIELKTNGNLTLKRGTALASTGALSLHVYDGLDVEASLGTYHNGTRTVGHIFLKESDDSALSYIYTNASGHLAMTSTITNVGTGGVTVDGQTSDRRLKQNIAPLDRGLTALKNLQPKTFEFISEPGVVKLGFLADELATVIPEAVFNSYDTRDGVENVLYIKPDMIIPLTVQAIKDLDAQYQATKAEVISLRTELEAAKAAIEEMRADIQELKDAA
jgi:hypothetical protein